jgi:hypothetical protein
LTRLSILDDERDPALAQLLAERGFVSDMRRILIHRPDLLGDPLSALLQVVMRESQSEWTVGERELIAAFVASQRQCPF